MRTGGATRLLIANELGSLVAGEERPRCERFTEPSSKVLAVTAAFGGSPDRNWGTIRD